MKSVYTNSHTKWRTALAQLRKSLQEQKNKIIPEV